MSGSKHTDPPGIRATRRVARPDEQRGATDPSRDRNVARLLKELGVDGGDAAAKAAREARTAVNVTRPRPGFHHPASAADIRSVLEFFGPIVRYGIRSIELRQRGDSVATIKIAELRNPGVVRLFEQPLGIWRIPGQLTPSTASQLLEAGARFDETPITTLVEWPDPVDLRDFVLFDGLLHEIGHHLIQHHTGKRSARVMRTRDHELQAAVFAKSCRQTWRDATA